jgi:hypothetical protein
MSFVTVFICISLNDIPRILFEGRGVELASNSSFGEIF